MLHPPPQAHNETVMSLPSILQIQSCRNGRTVVRLKLALHLVHGRSSQRLQQPLRKQGLFGICKDDFSET